MQTAANPPDLLLELFETELQGVCFPEVDATSLAAHHEAVELAARAVEEAEQLLARAASDLAEKKQALAQHGKRALAYVKVYAEERPALRERVEALYASRGKTGSLALELDGTEPRRRGRPRKVVEPRPSETRFSEGLLAASADALPLAANGQS